jgi:hypothetical protein
VVPPIVVSSDEVVMALLRAGFSLSERDERACLLIRGFRAVTVGHAERVDHDALLEILRAAAIAYADFVDHLDAAQTPDDDGADPNESHVRVRFAGRTRKLGR